MTDIIDARGSGGQPRIFFYKNLDVLPDSGIVDTGFFDAKNLDKYQVDFEADAGGLNIEFISKSTEVAPEFSTGLGDPFNSRLYLARLPARDRFIKIRVHNLTGSDVNNFNISLKGFYGSSDGASVLPLSRNPVPPSGAILTKSVITGQDPNGNFTNVGINQAGAVLVADFGIEVARDLYEGYEVSTKFGRNPDIDTVTAPEDIYNGGNEYTGFNATGNEEISATSSSGNDTGSLVSNGTTTGGSNTTLIDSSATFITDGVAVGDLVINDTQGIHGVITSVDSETQITVFEMIDGIADSIANNAGDVYRIATATNTGCAVLKLKSVLNENYEEQTSVYIILNGTTTVTTTGVSAMRCTTGRSILSGSNSINVGQITVTQAVSTSNVFCVIPTLGSTTIGCFTVPLGKDCIIKRVQASIVRASGAAGSATIALNVRRFGQSFNAERVYELQASAPIDDQITGGIVLPPGSDVKGTVESVSDNNSIAQINIDYYFIDRV